jgi:hypothetical protein
LERERLEDRPHVTIATDLRVALAPTIQLIVDEFGVTVTLRRPSSTRAADNTSVTITPAVAGAPSPTKVAFLSGKKVDLQKAFGQETEAEILALVRDNVPVLSKDRVDVAPAASPMWGSSSHHYEINEMEPLEAAGAWMLGLSRVPALAAS